MMLPLEDGARLQVQSQPRAAATGRKGSRQCRRAGVILAIGSPVVAGIVACAWLSGLRVNLTPSEPLGLWRIVPLDRVVAVGDLVFVCPPVGPVSDFGLERGYFRGGLCPGGTAPLIKTVAAREGSHIRVGANVAINGRTLPQSRLISVDGHGRPLTPWAGGAVPPGQLFLHSPFAGSYDSRYFGPVPTAGLLGLARPVLTFDP